MHVMSKKHNLHARLWVGIVSTTTIQTRKVIRTYKLMLMGMSDMVKT